LAEPVPPEDGELFDQPEHAFARLQCYSLATGFCGVKGQGTTHSTEELFGASTMDDGSDETRNGRKLSAYVERDPNDSKKIISTRKREFTSEYADNCAPLVPSTQP
jgi:hypothetical protein